MLNAYIQSYQTIYYLYLNKMITQTIKQSVIKMKQDLNTKLMKNSITTIALVLIIVFTTHAQSHVNGQLDNIKDLSTVKTVPITMPDGVKLMTDIYMPITSDSVTVDVNLAGIDANVVLIPKGTQLFVYDSLHNEPNPNPYQLPLIFTRTPYNKNSDEVGYIVNILGYNYALQDMRGRYESEGVYFPMLSDSWAKAPYHPDYSHQLDVTELDDPKNSNQHEDGYHSIQSLLQLTHQYDLDGDGLGETTANLCNGNIGMFGASALGNTQYQAAAARKINPDEPGLKCLVPLVATNDHYNSTGYNNGVFRESLVSGWVNGQIRDLSEAISEDDAIHNNIHTPADYNLTNKNEVAEKCIDHFSVSNYGEQVSAAYPNSSMRSEMDASRAPVNAEGLGDLNGNSSRYSNMEVPMYHISGWWDIFVNGQIDTYNRIRQHVSSENRNLQKLIIGPWAHQTTGATKTGDIIYPANVKNIIGLDINDVDFENLAINELVNSEVIAWYRYNLNETKGLGEPKILIPESKRWQDLDIFNARVPAKPYLITLAQLFNFLSGSENLPNVPIELATAQGDTIDLDFPIPEIDLGEFGLSGDAIKGFAKLDFKNEVPNVRFYVAGPVDDDIVENEMLGNYWFESDVFPLGKDEGVFMDEYLLTKNGTFEEADEETSIEEGLLSFMHNPDEPVLTIGGGNMITQTPDGRASQGQLDLTKYQTETLDESKVLQFTSPVIEDSLVIIGAPVARLFASSNPVGVAEGLTDTDFFVRIVDVYPDGAEYFVVEGAINARARAYAKSLLDNNEDINAPFTNIEIGEVYEYEFKMMPIAYAFGKGHQLKVLISSSNYDRYQVNANVPIEAGDFFRRKPGDGQTYTFNGEIMAPRIAEQQIFFSATHPSGIQLPVYDPDRIVSIEESQWLKNGLRIYPNPAHDQLYIENKLNQSG